MSRSTRRSMGRSVSPEAASVPRVSRSSTGAAVAASDSAVKSRTSSNTSSSSKKKTVASKRTASPAAPVVRRRPTERATDDSEPTSRAVSPHSAAFISESLLAPEQDKAAPKTSPAATPAKPAAVAAKRTPYSPSTPAGDDHPLSHLRHAADAGKLQLGFHNDQYIEDISVEWMYRPHTVTALAIIIGMLIFLAFRVDESADWVSEPSLPRRHTRNLLWHSSYLSL